MEDKEKNNTEKVVLKPNPAHHFAGLMTSAGLPLGRMTKSIINPF
jgi:hypothetical protein